MGLHRRPLATSRRPLLLRVLECSGILRLFVTNDHNHSFTGWTRLALLTNTA